MDEKDIKIEIKLKNKAKLLANADIQFLTKAYGWISIKDFQIWKSENLNQRLGEFLNIVPPTVRTYGGKYMKRVFFEDEKKWELIEKSIFDEYKKKEAENAPIDYDAINNIGLSNSSIE